MTETPTHYSLAQVARLFRQLPSTIKRRCANGEFDYVVGPDGRHQITADSVRKHMKELEMKHNG